jgi:ACS family tartrate transporter-like MFS transporter
VLLTPVVLTYLVDRPSQATWLTNDERAWLVQTMDAEQRDTPQAHLTVRDAFLSGRLWALSMLYLCIVTAFYGVSFWLPQIVQATSGLGSSTIVLLSALPYIAATMGLVLIGMRSDRHGERRWHVAVPCVIGAIGFIATVLAPATLTISLITLSIAAFGIWGALGPFWTLPPAFLRGPAAAGGIAIVNSVGAIGGFAGPFLIGWVRTTTGNFSAGLLTLAAVLLCGATIAVAIPATRK